MKNFYGDFIPVIVEQEIDIQDRYLKEINNLQKVLTKSNIFTIILVHSGYSKDRDNEVIVNDYTRRTKLAEHYSELGFEIEEISMYETHITWSNK